MLRNRCLSLMPVVLVGALVACNEAPGEARLSASWIGTDTGEVTASPEVIWCRDARRLEVKLVKDDLAVGLVLYPTDSLGAGEFPAFNPADTVTRPSSAAAVRWFTEQAIEGYRSDSGLLVLEEAGGRFSGRYGFRMHSLDSAKIIRLTGTLSSAVPGVCRTDSLPARAPTQ